MATYLVLNILFLIIAVAVFAYLKKLVLNNATIYVGLILLVLTIVFDSLIIAAGIVDYNLSRIIGIYIVKAPIEDFFYTLFVVIAVPSLWLIAGRFTDERKD